MVEQARHILCRILLAVAIFAGGAANAQSPSGSGGTINTNVFDGVSGRYAEGMKVDLVEVKGETIHLVSTSTIDVRGRADLISGRPLAVGQYELRFQVADYFRSRSVPVGDPPYLDYVPVRFSVDTPDGYYHVPLICTPWSYSTYRGS